MNNVVQILFHKERRQYFLSKERVDLFNEYYKKSMTNYIKWLDSDSIIDQYNGIWAIAQNFWDMFRISYTRGDKIDLLPSIFDQLIIYEKELINFWLKNKIDLQNHNYYLAPMPWFYTEYYLKVLGLISLCYLLHREDLLPQLLQIILDNAADDLEPDSTIEDFFYYRFKDRPDPNYIQMGDHAVLISDAIREKDKNEKKALLHQYLKDWYKEMVGMSDLEYNSHLDPEQNGFCGYWSFEAAAIAYLDDVDDAEFYQYPYYPKDLVEWAREQRRIRYAEQDSASQHPLLLSVGKNVPFSGKYGVDNFSGFERHFQAGDVLPNGQVSGKRDEEGNPIFRKDAIWRLLSRDDGGSTRFTSDELDKYQINQS